MSGNTKECREHGKQCLERAKTAPSLLLAKRFEGLAHSWLRLANDLERADALVQQLHMPARMAS
jgi:hypothetical protein